MGRKFGGFELDLAQSRLLRAGVEIELEPRAFDLLRYLAEHADRLVSKEELVREVWRARSLSAGVTANAVAKLRRALEQGPDRDRPIETVHGRGYRFHYDDPEHVPEPEPPSLMPLDPFVGRESALTSLARRLARAQAGKGSLVLVTGAAGIGKTRVVHELARRALTVSAERPTSVWTGIAHDAEGAPPYWPWIQVLREAWRELGESAFRALLPEPCWALHQLLPELGPAPFAPGEREPERVRFAVFDELVRWFVSASVQRTVIVLLDDLQWADVASVELLAFATRSLQPCSVLFLATVRSPAESGAATAPVPQASEVRRAAFTTLARLGNQLALGGLSAEEVDELASALPVGRSLPAERARQLHARTGGNPFFVRQLLEWWAQRDTAPAERELPPAIRDLLLDKLASLPPPARRALALASVLGQRFSATRLAALLQRSQPELLDQLEPALRASLIARLPSSETFVFEHDLLRETLYDDLGVRERGALHGAIADGLRAEPSERTRHELAHHLLHALPARLEEAVQACRAAAGAAHEAAGFESAARMIDLAIEKMEAEHGDPLVLGELWVELGDNHVYVAALERAWEAYRRAAEIGQRLQNVPLLAKVAPRLVDCVEIGVGSAGFARALVEQVLAGMPVDQLAERAMLLAQKAELALELPCQQRFALLDQADQLAAQHGSPAIALDVAHSRAILREPTARADNVRAAERMLALMEQHSREADTMRYRALRRFNALFTLYVSALTDCDLTKADAECARIRELAHDSHVRAVGVGARLMEAGRALGDGRLNDLERILAGADNYEGDLSTIAEAFRSYQFLLLEARDQLAVLSGLELPALRNEAPGRPRHRTDVAIMRAYVYARTARPEHARQCLAQLPAVDLARMPVLYGDLGIMSLLAELYVMLDDHAAAAALYERLAPHASANAVLPTFAYRGAVAYSLGLLARALAEPTRARQHFEQAIEINAAMNMPHHTALARRAISG